MLTNDTLRNGITLTAPYAEGGRARCWARDMDRGNQIHL